MQTRCSATLSQTARIRPSLYDPLPVHPRAPRTQHTEQASQNISQIQSPALFVSCRGLSCTTYGRGCISPVVKCSIRTHYVVACAHTLASIYIDIHVRMSCSGYFVQTRLSPDDVDALRRMPKRRQISLASPMCSVSPIGEAQDVNCAALCDAAASTPTRPKRATGQRAHRQLATAPRAQLSRKP